MMLIINLQAMGVKA